MAEETDKKFKITDRRKYNIDGSPRDHVDEAPVEKKQPEPLQSEGPARQDQPPSQGGSKPEQTEAKGGADNIVSFPGEGARNRPGEPKPAGADAQAGQAAQAAFAAEQAYVQANSARPREIPEASFDTLLNMLAGEAAMLMGMVESPGGGQLPVDLEAARHMIDMLGMLQQKTRGNLTADESNQLENVLAYLRMQYVALSRKR
jgi:hypothetical protein